MVTPLVTQQIEDLSVSSDSDLTTIDLSATFDDPSTTGQIARFEFADNINDGGTVDVLLFDQEGVGAPATVENFLNYVEDGDYDNSIIHRSIPGFVVQGGGFDVTNSQITPIPADDPVVNEFNSERSNVRGTIAMAKVGGDPDSATNGWFFNLVDNNDPDNPNSLDNQNGGFTAFGQVLGDEDLETVDAIADLSLIDGDPPPAQTLDNLPITDTADPINTEDLVYLESVTSISENELEFSVVENSNGELVEATITDGELTLDYVDGESGEATITLEATNLLGESVEETFVVNVETPEVETPEVETPEVETPEVETPEVETPEVETPEVETPEVETPEVETPEVETPEVETPEVETPEVETPEVETPEVETPEVETPEVETPDVETPEVETPEVEIPEVETPEVETPDVETPDVETPVSNLIGSTVFRFLDPDTGIHFYADSEAERDELLADEPDLVAEDLGYRTVDPVTDNAQEVFSFFNEDTGAYLYTVDQNEREFIEDNLDNYTQESDSFSVFTEEQTDTIPIYRFLDTNTGAHFYTPSSAERDVIEDNFSNYNSEGIAFYAFDAGE